MKSQHRQTPFWHLPVLKWFFSLHIGLVLLALLTVVSIIGTLIPPLKDAQGNVMVSALERSQALVYYTWWYKYLLLLPLALNMCCATVRTLLEKVLPVARPRFMHQPGFYESTPSHAVIPYAGDAATVANAFRRQGFKVHVEGSCGYAFKGLLGRWGAPISHFGFVLVLLGGFASAWFAREAGLWLAEGMQSDKMQLSGVSEAEVPMGFTLRCEDFDTGFFPKTRIPSHFVSQITALEGDRPARTGPVEVNRSFKVGGWKLHQSSYRPLDDWERYRIAVAVPERPTTVTVELSPGQRRPLPAPAGTEVELSPSAPLQWTVHQAGKAVASGPLVQPLTGAWVLSAIQFEPDFVMGEAIGSRSQTLNNPALKVMLYQGDRAVYSQWLFAKPEMKEMMRGMMHNRQGPFTLELMGVDGQAPQWCCQVAVRDPAGVRIGDYHVIVGQQVALGSPLPAVPPPSLGGWRVKVEERVPAYATYLTLTRNPMIPVVYGGCAVMILGLLAAFCIRLRRVWFLVDREGGSLRVAAIYRNAQAGLDGATQSALKRLAAAGPVAPARQRV